MSNDENKFQPIFQILHIKSAWFMLELAMALVTTIGMRFLQVWYVCLLFGEMSYRVPIFSFPFKMKKQGLKCLSNAQTFRNLYLHLVQLIISSRLRARFQMFKSVKDPECTEQ